MPSPKWLMRRPGAGEMLKSVSWNPRLVLGQFVGLATIYLVFLVCGVPSSFFSVDNTKLVLVQTVIVGVGALGMTLIIISGGIDLSVGSVIALTSVTTV